ncbi:hypothetical protein INT47_012414 [Mucor saturninus]|uniref:CAP-Gly domain-containing protein n=1 Tax=Mucor saturninus TaxID=64648 RepID=A0A8H7QWS7_9FUNG|nr:hypothetical protein INT47_012414 [Mucor saturninus]
MSNNSRIARPSSVTSINHFPMNNRQRISCDYEKKKHKRPTSGLSKSQSMHRLAYLSDDDDDDEEDEEQQRHHRAILSRATTTPMPRPSSLIKRFSSDHHHPGVLVPKSSLTRTNSVKSASSTTSNNSPAKASAMKRSSSLMNPVDYTSSGNDEYHYFRLGQKVSVPSMAVFGTVRFYGETRFTHGNWVGIELEIKGSGKNDGSIQGLVSLIVAIEKPKRTTQPPAIKKTMMKRTTTLPAPATPAPSKSARILSNSHYQPLPTRSSPSSVLNKKTTQNIPSSKSTHTAKLKKSCSLSTADGNHELPMRPSSSSKTTRTEVDELKRVSALLEKSRQEQKALSQQMDGKEAAWERLVSAKESYALRVQEKEDELVRLKREIAQTQLANEQLKKMSSEKEGALSRASMSEAMERQHIKVIERLDLRVKTLQDENTKLVSTYESKLRDHAAKIDQLYKQLSEHDASTAAIERECADLRHVNRENLRAYEASMHELQQEYQDTVIMKDTQIQKLQYMVNDFSNCLSPSYSPILQDDSRSRLEAQLDLSTQELDHERELRKAMASDIDQLKAEIKRLHRASISSSSQVCSIRDELENEIKDKRRIMEEANAALESQSRIEEENERIRLTHDKTQRDLADLLRKLASMEKQRNTMADEESLLERNRQLELENERILELQRQTEHECMRLMDEILTIEKSNEDQQDDDKEEERGGDERMYKKEIEQLKLHVLRETKKYQDLETTKQVKLDQLNKELSDLESLVENKVFHETELEERLENEKRKVRSLEAKLKEEDDHKRMMMHNPPMSPTSPQYPSMFQRNKKRSSSTTASSFTLMTSSSLDTVSDHGALLESVYCEICEDYGHDVMTCTAFIPIEDYEHDALPSSSYYCVNCDIFGIHPTEECPSQDETF